MMHIFENGNKKNKKNQINKLKKKKNHISFLE